MLHNLRDSIAHSLCDRALCSCTLRSQPGLYAVALGKRGLAYFVSECLYCKSVSPVHFIYLLMIIPRGFLQGFPGDSAANNPPANTGDVGSIPGWGGSPENGMATHSSVLASEIPWTEEPGGL